MRCMACGAEMRLMQAVQDETMPVPGYEHHTFMCPVCADVESRLVFTRNSEPAPARPAQEHSAPPISPAASVQASAAPAEVGPSARAAPVEPSASGAGLFKRVVARLRGRDRG
jgi:hypothetical protein